MGYALRAAEILDRVEQTRRLFQAMAQDGDTDSLVGE